MKITLLHPSRGRADKAKQTVMYWLNKASKENIIEHVLSLDLDDKELPKYIDNFKDMPNSCGIANNNTCVVEATNHAAKVATGNILIYLSDDFLCPDNWDQEIINVFTNNLNDFALPRLIKVDDNLQKFDVKVLTIPIMNRALYKKLGYFWHPGYKSMFVDEDLWWTCHNNGWMINAPQLVFPHMHCCIGKSERDETYIRSESNWDSGKAFFAERKSLNFPL
jgi:hypothetical protein